MLSIIKKTVNQLMRIVFQKVNKYPVSLLDKPQLTTNSR